MWEEHFGESAETISPDSGIRSAVLAARGERGQAAGLTRTFHDSQSAPQGGRRAGTKYPEEKTKGS